MHFRQTGSDGPRQLTGGQRGNYQPSLGEEGTGAPGRQLTLTFSRKCGQGAENANVGFTPSDIYPEFFPPLRVS